MRYDTYLKVEQLAESFGTYDPFPLAEKLGFQTHFEDIGKGKGFCQNILGVTDIVLSDSIRYSPERLSVMAHELGHGIEDTDCLAWYTTGEYQKNSIEYQANSFACAMLSKLYEEENDQRPEDFKILQTTYGMPDSFYSFFNSADILYD